MAIDVASDDKECMLSMLNDTPPITAMLSGSEDQRRELQRVKQRHLFLREKLAAYFNGQSELEIEGLSPFDQASLELEKDRLLALYALVQGSWGSITRMCELAGVFLSDAGIHQPGELMAAFIEGQAADLVDKISSPFFRWSPSESRKAIKEMKECIKLLDAKQYRELRAPERRKIDKVVAKTDKAALNSRTALPMALIMNCCRELAKQSGQHSAVRGRLENYNAASARMIKLTSAELHPRKGRKGWELVKGRKRTMGSKGGVASA